MRMKGLWAGFLLAGMVLTACVPVQTADTRHSRGGQAGQANSHVVPVSAAELGPRAAAQNFVAVIDRLEPVTEDLCRRKTRGVKCDFLIVVDDRPGQPPNAFQTLDRRGRPVLGFTLALIADARNPDEIAFVLGHEASHHILGHIPQTKANAQGAAMMAGILAAASGASPEAARQLQTMAATVGARGYAKEFELEADALGAEIAWRSGYDPVLGAGFFDRLPDPGDQFLGSHPPNAQRKAQVRQIVAQLKTERG